MANRKNNRRRKRDYNTIDSAANREAGSIATMAMIGNVQQSRLNITYRVDGFVFNTGKRHRSGGNW